MSTKQQTQHIDCPTCGRETRTDEQTGEEFCVSCGLDFETKGEPVQPSEKTDYTNHKAADFMNAGGEHIVSLQLLNVNRQAVAVADLRNGKVERFDCAIACRGYARGPWLAMVLKLYGHNS